MVTNKTILDNSAKRFIDYNTKYIITVLTTQYVCNVHLRVWYESDYLRNGKLQAVF